MTVHALPADKPPSIPAGLRRAADMVENEANVDCSPTVAVVMVQLAACGRIITYGWGDTDDDRVCGILARAKHELLEELSERTK